MAAKRWTDEQRQHALERALHDGYAEAARQTGIPKGTIASWARRAGVHTRIDPPAQYARAVETASLAAEERRLVLADLMAGRAQAILERMDEVLAKATEAEVITAADVRHLASAVGTLVEKVQLLTGEATSRDDHTGGVSLEDELRQFQALQSEAAAIRRAKDAL